jgi:RNA polymerase sigma factor (sigma-70 family)
MTSATLVRPPPSVGFTPMSEVETDIDDVADLVARAADGDGDAWAALVDRFGSLVFAVCRGFRLSPADAGDVSQTVWLRLAEHIGRLSQPGRVGAWLVTTAKRECLAHQQARARFEPADLDLRESPTPLDGPEHTTLRQESVNEVAEAFALLTQRCRELLRRVVADRTESYKEISVSLGIPVGAIGPTRSRCLDQLRRHLEGAGHAG